MSDNVFLTDPVIERLAKDGVAQVFMTDVAAAAIMCAGKAVFSWDLVFKKFGHMVFIEKRDEENIMDWHSIGETAVPDIQPLDVDGINGVRFMMKEAAQTQTDFHYYSQNKKVFTDMEDEIPLEVED